MNSLTNILAAPAANDSLERHRVDALPILVIHAHTSCNCRCVMCDIWKTPHGQALGVAQLQAQIASIRSLGVKWVVFSGGEPLLNDQLPALCQILRQEEIRLTLLTTGLLLKKCAAEVAANFDDVIVSIDGPEEIHDAIRRVKNGFQLLQAGIAALRTARPNMRITARTTVQKANHAHLCDTVIAAKRLGLQGISFLAADLTSEAFNRESGWSAGRQSEIALSPPEIPVLANEIESLARDFADEIRTGFIAESADKLRRIIRHFRAHLGAETHASPVCNAPWVSAVIETDGSVRPCFFHKPIGSLRNAPLQQIVNGGPALNFRAGLDVKSDSSCNRCVCSLNYRP